MSAKKSVRWTVSAGVTPAFKVQCIEALWRYHVAARRHKDVRSGAAGMWSFERDVKAAIRQPLLVAEATVKPDQKHLGDRWLFYTCSSQDAGLDPVTKVVVAVDSDPPSLVTAYPCDSFLNERRDWVRIIQDDRGQDEPCESGGQHAGGARPRVAPPAAPKPKRSGTKHRIGDTVRVNRPEDEAKLLKYSLGPEEWQQLLDSLPNDAAGKLRSAVGDANPASGDTKQ